MATIRKHRDRWQVRVRRAGLRPMSKSFAVRKSTSSLVPSCRFGLSFGAKPAFAEALVYVDLRIVQLPRQMINALALPVDVALDHAFERRCFRSRDGTEKDGLSVYRY